MDLVCTLLLKLTPLGKGAVDFAEFMKMMSRGGASVAGELKETFGIFNKSGRCEM